MKTRRLLSYALGTILLVGVIEKGEAAQRRVPGSPTTTCDLADLSRAKQEFERLVRIRSANPASVLDDALREASNAYISRAESCYQELYGSPSVRFDDGPLFATPEDEHWFQLGGTKWGAGSPYAGGYDASGPRIPGGTVTYSFMSSGISFSGEGYDTSLAFSNLPGFQGCFLNEITNAFAAWSAVANIQFQQVADNGAAFGAAGATGDIRIAAHTFDGPSGVLAHAYLPPAPGSSSRAGDMHFDRQETWSCTPGAGVIDIGIVAMHELGHSIGLLHEDRVGHTALMNPFYNPSVAGSPLADDINGAVNIYGFNPPPVGRTPVVSTVRDYDGDGKADIAVFRNSNGDWLVNQSSGGLLQVYWGAPSLQDQPVPADYDGDGKADIAVYRRTTSQWFIRQSSNGAVVQISWGAPSLDDLPAPADYDGDGKADIAVYRASTGQWFIRRSSDNVLMQVNWGAPSLGDIPVPADYDGDHKADIAVYRRSTGQWFILGSSDSSLLQVGWGAPSLGDVPIPADYDGDGKADIAVFRQSSGDWYVLQSSNGSLLQVYWGAPSLGDTPVPGDFDGDGKADIAVYRTSTGGWFIRRSSDSGLTNVGWGSPALLDVVR